MIWLAAAWYALVGYVVAVWLGPLRWRQVTKLLGRPPVPDNMEARSRVTQQVIIGLLWPVALLVEAADRAYMWRTRRAFKRVTYKNIKVLDKCPHAHLCLRCGAFMDCDEVCKCPDNYSAVIVIRARLNGEHLWVEPVFSSGAPLFRLRNQPLFTPVTYGVMVSCAYVEGEGLYVRSRIGLPEPVENRGENHVDAEFEDTDLS